jgi:hypothetical protein
VYVHGYRSSKGWFSLTVDELENNDLCENAIEVVAFEAPVFGSTRGATLDAVGACFSANPTAPGVWYSVLGLEIFTTAIVLADTTAFSGQISVFRGACDALECVAGSFLGSVSWDSVEGERFFVLVHGQGIVEGDFSLEVIDGERKFRIQSDCRVALVVQPGSSIIASTENYSVQDVGSCGNLVFSTGPGRWYNMTGTGGVFRASTCDTATDFDSQISVYGGSCDSLECIDGNDQAANCDNFGSSVSWFTEDGEPYFLLGTLGEVICLLC